MQHSKNFDRYRKWYKKGAITEEQLEGLVEAGLITEEEKNEIIAGDPAAA